MSTKNRKPKPTGLDSKPYKTSLNRVTIISTVTTILYIVTTLDGVFFIS